MTNETKVMVGFACLLIGTAIIFIMGIVREYFFKKKGILYPSRKKGIIIIVISILFFGIGIAILIPTFE